ncbi:MAG TPA: nuclear transport factor 2 family protein [Gaiellaceae bacterium]|nr:nuclear transport factor 2 family protein [Gaiellaceae bacterium]
MKRLALIAGATALAALLVRRFRRGHGGGGDHEDAVRAYFEAWSEGDADAIRELVSDDYQAHVHGLQGTEERDADELVSVVDGHAEAFSEVEYELHEVISHNGHVAVRATMHAAHEETGKEGEIDGIAILRFDGDRIAEEWSSWDYLDLANQLGLAEGG